VQAIADKADAHRLHSLVLAGWTPGWPALAAAEWTAQIGHTTRLADDPEEVRAGEIVIWLGEAATGADYFARMRIRLPEVPFWLALAGDSPVFYQRAIAHFDSNPTPIKLGEVYWTAWLDGDYPQWAAVHSPNTPTAYAIYRATQLAIAQIAGGNTEMPPPFLYVFQLTETGDNRRQVFNHLQT
jgi:hypothetical protein